MTTNELIEQARQLLIASPRGGEVKLEGIPFRDFPTDSDWNRGVYESSGRLYAMNTLIEDDHGVHIGTIILKSAENAERSGAWILPDGTEYAS